MASASTSSDEKSYMYDVFVSFRGKDLRLSFVDHLFEAFRRSGIIVFKDDKDIETGEKIGEELPKAIQDSKFHIVIFSKRYVDSYWCLNELIQILECRKPGDPTVYAIFYHVTPNQVRDQKGPIRKAFAKRSKNEAAGRWRAAMAEAASLKGWELAKTGDGHEVQFIEKIVRTILQKSYFANFSVNDNLVGVATPVEKLLLSLQVGVDDVRMLGITGLGGVGKTTLASVVFNRIANQFEGKSFVQNVRECSEDTRGLQDMQKQILTSVFGDQSIVVPSDFEGRRMMKRRMPSIKVLVVLDDVNDLKQLEKLAEPSWFRPGSRIIITSRDRQVLVAHGVHNIHDVSTLTYEDAVRLLSRYAFNTQSPAQGYEKLSQKVVSYAAGLPLTIKTLSSSLRGCPTHVWEDAIKRLKEIPWGDTLKILKISYDALEEDQKQIFLHVACLLKGETKKQAVRILESLGFRAQFGLSVLEQKSLITFRDDYFHEELLVLHDHIEEMGMHIVRSSDTDKLLWKKDEIENIVEKDMGTEAIRGIKLLYPGLDPAEISQSLRKMRKLCFLYVGGSVVVSVTSELNEAAGKYLPNSLQVLQWHRYPYRYLPKTFEADKLVEMEMMNSNIHQLWEGGETKVLPKLRFLDLRFSKLETFDSAMTPNLEELVLYGCKELVEVNISDEGLHLKKLDLSHSRALEKLTISSNKCRNLEKLDLCKCSSFRELQMHGECLCLKYLDLSKTKLRSLNFGLTPNLEDLKLYNCKDLEELVMPVECQKLSKLSLGAIKLHTLNLGLTPNLEELSLEDCKHLEEIYVPVEHPARLRVLSLTRSNNERLLSYLEKLKSLEELRLSFGDMNRLPDSIYMLKHLRLLSLAFCRQLKQLPEDLDRLECLEELYLWDCESLGNIPDCICKMTRLKILNLSRCFKLEKLPDEFRRLQSLQVLDVWQIADRLKNLPESISQLTHLVVKK